MIFRLFCKSPPRHFIRSGWPFGSLTTFFSAATRDTTIFLRWLIKLILSGTSEGNRNTAAACGSLQEWISELQVTATTNSIPKVHATSKARLSCRKTSDPPKLWKRCCAMRNYFWLLHTIRQIWLNPECPKHSKTKCTQQKPGFVLLKYFTPHPFEKISKCTWAVLLQDFGFVSFCCSPRPCWRHGKSKAFHQQWRCQGFEDFNHNAPPRASSTLRGPCHAFLGATLHCFLVLGISFFQRFR